MNQLFNPVFKHYADFKGRASKREFWPFALLFTLISLPIRILGYMDEDSISPALAVVSLLLALLTLALLLPALAACVRRLHDIGKSGWWLLIGLIPLGGLVLLYFYLQDSEKISNKWGPHPDMRVPDGRTVSAVNSDW